MILSAAASSAGGLATAYAFASPSSRAPDLASGIPPLRMGSEYEFRCFDDKVGCWCRDAADGVRAVMLYPVRRETHEYSRSRVCAHACKLVSCQNAFGNMRASGAVRDLHLPRCRANRSRKLRPLVDCKTD